MYSVITLDTHEIYEKLNMGKSIFPTPWWEVFTNNTRRLPPCKYEWCIYDVSKAIRKKPNWQTKYKNDEIFERWTMEISGQLQGLSDAKVKEIFQYVRKELRWYERLPAKFPGFEESSFQMAFDDKIVTADKAISDATKETLIKQVSELRGLFKEVDYHPGTNKQVVDLVHPSLYPIVYGKTPIIKNGKIEICDFDAGLIHDTRKDSREWGISKNYQWIPSLLELEDGQYRFVSYINNLHPKNNALYRTIESVFNSSIPGVNLVLARFGSYGGLRVPYPQYGDIYAEEYHTKLQDLEDNDDGGLEIDDAIEELYSTRQEFFKDIEIKYERDPETIDFDLKEFKNLKVIVKLANIELTPENPTYEGGSWHLEGCANEDIVATILYYYDVSNITESKLSFRQAYQDPPYEQNDDFYCREVFGIEDEDPMVKNIGSVEALENRVIVFPNDYQHHVDGFELKDKSKSGHRKILCFFLVDPYNEAVITTKAVPPQQQESEWNQLVDKDYKSQILGLEAEWPMSLEKAKEIRVELMEERSTLSHGNSPSLPFTREFSLCEH